MSDGSGHRNGETGAIGREVSRAEWIRVCSSRSGIKRMWRIGLRSMCVRGKSGIVWKEHWLEKEFYCRWAEIGVMVVVHIELSMGGTHL